MPSNPWKTTMHLGELICLVFVPPALALRLQSFKAVTVPFTALKLCSLNVILNYCVLKMKTPHQLLMHSTAVRKYANKGRYSCFSYLFYMETTGGAAVAQLSLVYCSEEFFSLLEVVRRVLFLSTQKKEG